MKGRDLEDKVTYAPAPSLGSLSGSGSRGPSFAAVYLGRPKATFALGSRTLINQRKQKQIRFP